MLFFRNAGTRTGQNIMKRESLLYNKVGGGGVQCNICQRRCKIKDGRYGYCGTRLSDKGKLYTLIYGEISTWRVAPSEIKPIFHFIPGGRWLSLGSLGCNFRCIGCQNWDIAHFRVDRDGIYGTEYMSTETAIELAKKYGVDGISWTYNEPTISFEYTLDMAKLAKKGGLYTSYVTNGFITREALDIIGPYLDVFRVDIKGFSNEFYKKIANVADFKGILKVTERAKKRWSMWVEVVTNVIPGYNDSETELQRIACWIRDTLGKDTPWHVTRFVPHLKLDDIPFTPVATLEEARKVGVDAGLKFVYLGNVPGHPYENTYCPKCQRLLIRRYNYEILEYNIKNGNCIYCDEKIPIRQEPTNTLSVTE